MRALRIALVASIRFPIREPFAGGLEAQTWALAHGLTRRGHRVTLFAAPGSDTTLGVDELPVHRPVLSDAARSDRSMPSAEWMTEHHAYLQLMLRLADGVDGFDLVHNNSLHHLPVAMASALPMPVVTALHTPPTPWLESAIEAPARCPVTFTAVSEHTARAWAHVVDGATVVPNGVDTARWTPGPGGGPLVWSGRIVPEKGPHLALDAARTANRSVLVAGPISDRRYFEQAVRPRLGDGARYLGHLSQRALARLVGRASATLVTPCWDEPYGLVVAESLACGTPVCAFARGALPEILTPGCGSLVPADDTTALARAIASTTGLPRAEARRRAEQHCSVTAMIDRYERLYRELTA
ncbi:glycosyltransferase family 4 protein [Kitasatospora sp. NPDC093550]|uniref:glycosyltransferase family 4 protein n=1 Tax=Kitasatospora sp. NPDC093550 TaxID=3364089 RepID=UPI003816542B